MDRPRFYFFKFSSGIFKKCSKALIAKIFIVTNGLGGWQVLIFPELFLKSINAGTTAGFRVRVMQRFGGFFH
jgi:hypothetical protein